MTTTLIPDLTAAAAASTIAAEVHRRMAVSYLTYPTWPADVLRDRADWFAMAARADELEARHLSAADRREVRP